MSDNNQSSNSNPEVSMSKNQQNASTPGQGAQNPASASAIPDPVASPAQIPASQVVPPANLATPDSQVNPPAAVPPVVQPPAAPPVMPPAPAPGPSAPVASAQVLNSAATAPLNPDSGVQIAPATQAPAAAAEPDLANANLQAQANQTLASAQQPEPAIAPDGNQATVPDQSSAQHQTPAQVDKEALLNDLKKKMDEKKAEREMVVGLKHKKVEETTPESLLAEVKSSTQPQPKKKGKGGCLILFLLIILALGAAGYFFWDQIEAPIRQAMDKVEALWQKDDSDETPDLIESEIIDEDTNNQPDEPEVLLSPIEDPISLPVSAPVSLVDLPQDHTAYMYFGRVTDTDIDYLAVRSDYLLGDDVCDLLADYLDFDLREDLQQEGWGTGLPDQEEIDMYAISNQDSVSETGLEILSCQTAGNVLYLDFSSALKAYGGGSTRVGLIHELFELMARQYGAHSVFFSVQGIEASPEGRLQP